ncbi:PPC domain-containing protein [Desulfopila inferna]|uniref:PPC domain-containing protein n=1 Tax=Desulfopila inferna TaxID=468528 RepID=UPI0019657983|nr:PPC domain-containing protein [Desulfopila inferna]MBM9605779.1 PPC domain-containing protein [Desulfopila inferna]
MIIRKPIARLCLAVVLLFGLSTTSAIAEDAMLKGLPDPLQPQLSEDGLTVVDAVPLRAVINDPNPATLRRVPLPPEYSIDPSAATSSFTINYIAAGGTDKWEEPCSTFPASARTVFTAAANVWANILQSSVPITIKACWADMDSSSILGYSGGGSLHRDFSGAPRAGTFYSASLANALHGADLSTANEDMHITYNSNFNWYYGTDGNPGSSQHDLFTVVLHEIAHGLNFSGGMYVSGSTGYWYNYPYPNIYDTFMRDNSGNPLTTSYSDGTTALGTALLSNGLYFHGANAMAANGNTRVKIYAPATWASGSSYSHLDYNTFSSTVHRLMVYAISAGTATHDPGTITKGLLKDLGWVQGSGSSCTNLINGRGTSVNVAVSQEKCYQVSVPTSATKLEVILDNLTADLDLYTRYGAPATTSTFTCRPYKGSTTTEICTHTNPTAGNWYIMVHGYQEGAGRLTATTTKPAATTGFPWPLFYPAINGTKSLAAPLWGAGNEVCCSGGWASFNISSSGVTKHSVTQSCSASSSSWEGWQKTTVGKKSFTWSITTYNCGSLSGSFSFTLQAGKMYRFYSKWNGSSAEIWVMIYTNNARSASAADRQLAGTLEKGEFTMIGEELVAVIPSNGNTLFSDGQCRVE